MTSSSEIAQRDVVKRIEELGADQPVRVLFRFHAAFYFLLRDNPHFDGWLALINESKEQGVSLQFTYKYSDQSITSLARASQ